MRLQAKSYKLKAKAPLESVVAHNGNKSQARERGALSSLTGLTPLESFVTHNGNKSQARERGALSSLTGFTLIEVLLAMGIFGLLFGLGVPSVYRMYRGFVFSSEVQKFADALRTAEARSFTNQFGKSHGIFIQSDSFFVFQGGSFVSRDVQYDETYARADGISVSGPQKIVFSQFSGAPSLSGVWIFSNEAVSSTLSLNSQGALSW